MASRNSPAVDLEWLRSDGFVLIPDAAIGDAAVALRQKLYPLKAREGLDFCKQMVLDNPVIIQEFCCRDSRLIFSSASLKSSKHALTGALSEYTEFWAAILTMPTPS